MSVFEVLAPAKLTVSLRITGVRSDGYHLIDAEMVTLDLFDRLRIDPDSTGVHLEGDGDVVDVELGGPDDLIARALELAGIDAGVFVTKNIPAGAGLGGGSADAAAVLRWAGIGDLEAAVSIGADVPFCLVGGRARVQGIGEIVTSLPILGRSFTVVTPPVHCSTPEVYAMWDEMGGPQGPATNDLEAAAIRVAPELAAVRELLSERTGQTPKLAGSGSSWFVEGAFPDAGRVLHELAISTEVAPIPED